MRLKNNRLNYKNSKKLVDIKDELQTAKDTLD